eukprot:gene2660-8378_t
MAMLDQATYPEEELDVGKARVTGEQDPLEETELMQDAILQAQEGGDQMGEMQRELYKLNMSSDDDLARIINHTSYPDGIEGIRMLEAVFLGSTKPDGSPAKAAADSWMGHGGAGSLWTQALAKESEKLAGLANQNDEEHGPIDFRPIAILALLFAEATGDCLWAKWLLSLPRIQEDILCRAVFMFKKADGARSFGGGGLTCSR